jgi:hypothetical protein
MAKSRSKSRSKAKPAQPAAKPETPAAEPAAAVAAPAEPAAKPSPSPARGPRKIVWLHVLTVISATILIGAEVFGAAFAASWAVATLFSLGHIGARALDIFFMLCGVAIMVQFVRSAHLIEPFTKRA